MDLGEGHGRDLLVALAVVGGVLLLLTLYTGNWPPPVVVESNSMMHVNKAEYEGNFGDTRAEDVPYGRFGTIDPGDLVLVKDVSDAATVETFAGGGDEHYGLPGEVVVYYTNSQKAGVPIIHRAMTYVEVEGDGAQRSYEVRWAEGWDDSEARGCQDRDGTRVCVFGPDGVTIPELSMQDETFDRSGFITQGDNRAGNPAPDQVLGIYNEPVPLAQIQGVARGELPWFGLIKLTLTGNPGSTAEVREHPYFVSIGRMTAPQDLWVMLLVGLATVSVAPVALDWGIHYGRRWWADRDDDPGEGGDASPNPSSSGTDGGDEPPPGPASGTKQQAADEGHPEAPSEGDEDERIELRID